MSKRKLATVEEIRAATPRADRKCVRCIDAPARTNDKKLCVRCLRIVLKTADQMYRGPTVQCTKCGIVTLPSHSGTLCDKCEAVRRRNDETITEIRKRGEWPGESESDCSHQDQVLGMVAHTIRECIGEV